MDSWTSTKLAQSSRINLSRLGTNEKSPVSVSSWELLRSRIFNDGRRCGKKNEGRQELILVDLSTS